MPMPTQTPEAERRVALDNAEKLQVMLDSKKEADERRSLPQAVISECDAYGFRMPPSLIKLLHHNNGNKVAKVFF